jgi:tetratricopeptide (TPR) repeat protein
MRRTLVLIVFWAAGAVVATTLSAAVAADLDVDTRMREGTRMHDAGRFDAAIAVYEEILREHPSNSKAFYEAGFSSLAKRDFESAARWLERGLATSPSNTNEFNHLLGQAREGLGDLGGAEEAFRRAVAAAPDRATLHFSLGINLAKQRRFVEATRSLEDNLARRPTHAQGWAALAQILEERRWGSRALAAHARLLTLRPEPQLAAWSSRRLWPLLFAGVRNGSIEFDIERLERDQVDRVEEMVRMMTAARRPVAGGSDATFFAGSLDGLFATSSRRAGGDEANAFWSHHVYAYFDAARAAGHFETLVYEIRRPTEDPATLEWLAQHGTEVERFRQWSSAWSP